MDLIPMNTTHREAVRANGFTVVREALAPSEIGALRSAISRFVARGTDRRFLANGIFKAQVFTPEPDDVFLPLLANERIAIALREISDGPLMFINEMGIAVNTSAGWHKDTHGLKPFDVHADADFGVYKVLIYPQDQLGLNDEDFALKVRVGSHWMANETQGEELSIFIRAGDAIIMDVRLTHRGHNDITEGRGVVARALYSPFRRLAPAVTYAATSQLRASLGKNDRFLATVLFGKCNEHTAVYARTGRSVTQERWPEVVTTSKVPPQWASRLDSVGVRY